MKRAFSDDAGDESAGNAAISGDETAVGREIAPTHTPVPQIEQTEYIPTVLDLLKIMMPPSKIIRLTETEANHPEADVNNAVNMIEDKNEANDDQTAQPAAFEKLDQDFPFRLSVLLDSPPASYEEQIKYGWNEKDMSSNITLNEDKLTCYRHQKTLSTDCVRGKVGFTEGLHVWKVCWSTWARGSHAVIGVATQDTPLQSDGYMCIVGNDNHSWGWDLGRKLLYHDAQNNGSTMYPAMLMPFEFLRVPSIFLLVLDMDMGTLSFVVNGQYLGIAFRGLKGHRLFPIANAVWGQCKIGLKYIGGVGPYPSPLLDICRYTIRKQISKENLKKYVEDSDLPSILKAYLTFDPSNDIKNTDQEMMCSLM